MTDVSNALEARVSGELIEVRGCMSRTEWELVYLAASQFAQSSGLSITCFDLKPAELGEEGRFADGEPEATIVATG